MATTPPPTALKAYMDLPYALHVQGSVGRSHFLATHSLAATPPRGAGGGESTLSPYTPTAYAVTQASSSPYTYVGGRTEHEGRRVGAGGRTGGRRSDGSGSPGGGSGRRKVQKQKGHERAVGRMRRKIAEERVREREKVAAVRARMESRAARLASVTASPDGSAGARARARARAQSRSGSRSGSGSPAVGGRDAGRAASDAGSASPAARTAGHKLAQMRMHHRRLRNSKESQHETRRAEREALIRTLYKQKRRADIRRRLNTPRSYMETGSGKAAKVDPIADELARLAAQMEAADDDNDPDAVNIAPPPASFKALHFHPDPTGRIIVTPYEDLEDELLDLDNIDSIPDITYHTGDELSLLSDMDDPTEFESETEVLAFLDDSDDAAASAAAKRGRFVPPAELRKRAGRDAIADLAASPWEDTFVSDLEWIATHHPVPKRIVDLLDAAGRVLGLGPGTSILDEPQHSASRVRALLAYPEVADVVALEAVQPYIENPYYVAYSYRDDVPAAPFLCALLRALDKFYVPAPRASVNDLALTSLPVEDQANARAAGADNLVAASITRLVADLSEYDWVCALDPIYRVPYYVHTSSQLASWAPPPRSDSVIDLTLQRPHSTQLVAPHSGTYTLTVEVLEAHGLEQVSAFGSCSSFVSLSLNGHPVPGTTAVVHDSVDPVYKEAFEFSNVDAAANTVLTLSVLQAERDVAPEDSTLLFEADVDLTTVHAGDVLWLANDIGGVSGRLSVVCTSDLHHAKEDDLVVLSDNSDDGVDDGAVAGIGDLADDLGVDDIDDDELDAVLADVELGPDDGLDLGLDENDDLGDDFALDHNPAPLAALAIDDINSDDLDLGLDDVELDDDDAAELANEDFGLDDIDLGLDDVEDADPLDGDVFALSSESAPAGVSTTSPDKVSASAFVLSDD